jgi:hypothetical protein
MHVASIKLDILGCVAPPLYATLRLIENREQLVSEMSHL